MENRAVFTIGHSTYPLEKFVNLLSKHRIEVIADVRSTPYSRQNPQFNREILKSELGLIGIKYVYLGRELGARSDDRSCYSNGQVQYDLLASTKLFREGLSRVKIGAENYRVALMCAEKEPLDCHRTILVSKELIEEGLAVYHILGDGQLEDHQHAVRRLISKLGFPDFDMFLNERTLVEQAYRTRASQIAYKEGEVNLNHDDHDFDWSGSIR